MKILSCMYALALSASATQSPPTTGKFFYADMRSGMGQHEEGMHFIDTLISDQEQKFSLGINSQRYSMSLVSEKCDYHKCQVSHFYDEEQSSTKQYPQNDNLDNVAFIKTKQYLINTQLKAKAIKDQMILKIDGYDRQVKFDVVFESIEDASLAFSDDYDGYIGIAPYQANLEKKEANFMWQLKNHGLIDHMTLMLNSNVEDGDSSVLKFGSWDPSALAAGASLKNFRTKDTGSWAVQASTFFLDGDSFAAGVVKDIDFSPHLPYLYLPNGDWTHFAFRMGTKYPDIDCSYGSNHCRWSKPCSQVDQKPMPMAFKLFDADSSTLMTVDLNKMFIDGDNFGEKTGSFCYLPVFMSKHSGTQNTWFFGSMLMEDYIMIFDNSGYDERRASHNIVSLGKKNHAAVQQEIKKNYDTSAANYSPSSDDTTMSSLAPPPKPVTDDDDIIPDISGDGTDHPKESKDDDGTAKKDTDSKDTDTTRPYQQPAEHGELVAPPAGATPEYIIFMFGKMLSLSTSFTSIVMSVWRMISGMLGIGK